MYGSKNYEAITQVRVKEKERDVPFVDESHSFLVVLTFGNGLPKNIPGEISTNPQILIGDDQLLFVFPARNGHPWKGKHHTIIHWFSQSFLDCKEAIIVSFETFGELFGYVLAKGAKGGIIKRNGKSLTLPFEPERKKDYLDLLGF